MRAGLRLSPEEFRRKLSALSLAFILALLSMAGPLGQDHKKKPKKPPAPSTVPSITDILRNKKGIIEGLNPKGKKLEKKNGLNYPSLPVVRIAPGLAAPGPGVKEVTLKQKEFEKYWKQILDAEQNIEGVEQNLVEKWLDAGATTINEVKTHVFNMALFMDSAEEWVRKHPNELDYFLLYYPTEDVDIEGSEWSVAASPSSIFLIRKVYGEKYIVGSSDFIPRKVALPISKGDWHVYIFEKDLEPGNDYIDDFALLRLKNADKYEFDASERYDMWIAYKNGALHAWVEVPKNFEVVGLMPEIGKRMITVPTTGEKIPMYYRGYYIGLKNRVTGERNIFFVSVAEDKYGISVIFGLVKVGESE